MIETYKHSYICIYYDLFYYIWKQLKKWHLMYLIKKFKYVARNIIFFLGLNYSWIWSYKKIIISNQIILKNCMI